MTAEEKWDVCPPYPGAMVRVYTGQYYHYGIFIGDDSVVEFGSGSQATGDPSLIRIQRSTADEFISCGGFLEVRIFDRKDRRKKRRDKEIVEYALSRVGEGGYDLFHNNCQHFANMCVFGEKGSTQLDDLRREIAKKLK